MNVREEYTRRHLRGSQNAAGKAVAQDVSGHCTYVSVLQSEDNSEEEMFLFKRLRRRFGLISLPPSSKDSLYMKIWDENMKDKKMTSLEVCNDIRVKEKSVKSVKRQKP